VKPLVKLWFSKPDKEVDIPGHFGNMSATIETLELHTNPPNHDVDKTIELLPQWRKYPDSWTTLVIGEQLSECFIELIWKPLDQFFL
jgi:hypothetical protein